MSFHGRYRSQLEQILYQERQLVKGLSSAELQSYPSSFMIMFLHTCEGLLNYHYIITFLSFGAMSDGLRVFRII